MPTIELPAEGKKITVATGENLLDALKRNGIYPDAPCGGNGRCGKCKVQVNGTEVLACKRLVDRDMTVVLPKTQTVTICTGTSEVTGDGDGYALALDIGTTTVGAWLLDPHGGELAAAGVLNPQVAFGADVITRIRQALAGQAQALTQSIRSCVENLIRSLCQQCGVAPARIETVSLVGNPAMEQLFLGLPVDNLAHVPYDPVLRQIQWAAADAYLPDLTNARLLILPEISGFVGADTLAGVLAAGMDRQEELCLLVDIGTNGEMVLGNRDRMVACSTAAGPALEGAGISCGMRATEGAIGHVWRDTEGFGCSVIGKTEAAGICGSGLVDAVAAALDAGLINRRGKIENSEGVIALTEKLFLTQEDIRQVQQAKGAIAAGIYMLAEHLGVSLTDIRKVYLAGAFGSCLDPASVCRIGLLPPELSGRIAVMGNAAGSGACQLARDSRALARLQEICDRMEHLQLSAAEGFRRCFAQQMYFVPTLEYWCDVALRTGFSQACALDPQTLVAREDVRAMCAEDKCGAYNKNWTCPPAIGTVEQCQEKMRQYRQGILVQTVGRLKKNVDTKGYLRTEQQHLQHFDSLAKAVALRFPDALFLGAGGCRVCERCAYPEPCRFPEQAVSSMEGYGLFVTQVCRDAGVPYHYGEKTITYTACILIR